MARDFIPNDLLYLTSAITASMPLTMACWVSCDDLSGDYAFMSQADLSVNNHYYYMGLLNAPNTFFGSIRAGGSEYTFQTTTQASANTWHHAAVVFADSTNRAIYIDGGSKGTDSTSVSPAGIDGFAFGGLFRLTPGLFLNGKLAYGAVWSAALTDSEVATLASGFSPLLVRPQSLASYWPIYGDSHPEPDLVGKTSLLNSGSPPKFVTEPPLLNPHIINPLSAQVGHVLSSPPPSGGDSLASLYRAKRRQRATYIRM